MSNTAAPEASNLPVHVPLPVKPFTFPVPPAKVHVQVALTGAFFSGLCIFAWFQNGKRELLLAVLGLIAVTMAFFGLERWWVTENEAIQETVRQFKTLYQELITN